MADQIRSIVTAHEEEQLKFDAYAHAVTVIAEPHRLVHDGFYFNTTGKQLAWAAGTDKKFLIRTAAGNFPHVQAMLLNFAAGDVDFVAYEGPTVSAAGTQLDAVNVNRASSNTPDLGLYAEPTVTDNGTLIFTLWAPTSGDGKKLNGVEGVGQGTEWILNQSTDYLIVLTNNNAVEIDWSYEFAWYEIGYVINNREEVS